MQHLYKPFVIIALNRETYVHDELALIEALGENCPFKRVQGVYNGVGEDSYIVPIPSHDTDDKRLQTLIALAYANNQECILYVDGQRCAHLIETKNPGCSEHGKLRYCGRWQEVSKDGASQCSSYTKTNWDGFQPPRYFIVN